MLGLGIGGGAVFKFASLPEFARSLDEEIFANLVRDGGWEELVPREVAVCYDLGNGWLVCRFERGGQEFLDEGMKASLFGWGFVPCLGFLVGGEVEGALFALLGV